jgi:hypothetical protein
VDEMSKPTDVRTTDRALLPRTAGELDTAPLSVNPAACTIAAISERSLLNDE